jgi:hypothetical protein
MLLLEPSPAHRFIGFLFRHRNFLPCAYIAVGIPTWLLIEPRVTVAWELGSFDSSAATAQFCRKSDFVLEEPTRQTSRITIQLHLDECF